MSSGRIARIISSESSAGRSCGVQASSDFWTRVFCQYLVVDCGRITGTHAVTKNAGYPASDAVRLGSQDLVSRSFDASSLVLGLPLADEKKGLLAVGFSLVQYGPVVSTKESGESYDDNLGLLY
jgi:hypothetical protein